ncbi:hypothetical protein GGR51DRAFT_563451 [Nemania sp. FL0031]|nr:hypothetical protein GGR51DRAFT_563451 [Nemania sp. FL0031]
MFSLKRKRSVSPRPAPSSQSESIVAEGSHISVERSTTRAALEVLYPGVNEIEVDIVAVHGLGSNVDWSWTWQDNEGHRVHWLKDLLPNLIPNARIIAYNYESKWHADAPKTRLELCGEELIRSLHNFRTSAPERPIIFIAHSLGGLVVSYGLLYADRTENLKYLPASTVGFVPLGTPFRGTNTQKLAKIVACLMTPAGSHDGIINDLEPDNKHLADNVHAFCQLRNRLDIPITSVIELLPSDYGKKIGIAGLTSQMVVEEASAHIPGWGRAALNTDHFKLNKFSGLNDPSFTTVSHELRNMYTNRKSVMEKRKQITRSRHFMVPFGRNENFVGRDAFLEQLLERVPPSANKDDCQRTAVEGLGGIGKTQIAIETAYRVRDTYPDCSVFWVPVVDLIGFGNAYREIGKLLNIPGIDDDKADVKVVVKAGLENPHTGSWLLIIDNADDVDMLFQDAKLADYLPFSRQGSILFTTRSHKVAVRLGICPGNTISLHEMDDAEAASLLQKGLSRSQIGGGESTKRLLEYLANLPLAIKQASAFMESNTNVTVSQYLGFCESSDTDLIDLLSRQFEDRHRYKDQAEKQNPVATTWLISFNHISQHNPLAADYLKSTCLLAQKDIPLALLPATSSKIKMAEAIGTLHAYAFILKRDTPDSFDIHRLVRLVMRGWLQKNGEWEKWTTDAVHRLAKEYPWPKHENRAIWTRYLPHGQAVLELNCAIDIGDFNLPVFMAESYAILGRYSEAEQLYRQSLQHHEKALGREHPQTLATASNLGIALNRVGKYEEVENMHKQALELREKVLGKMHPNTLQSMNNLGATLNHLGKYEEAENMHKQALELGEKVLGKMHPDTLVSMHGLANIFDRQKKYEEAERLYQQVLELREEVLGRKHPDTLGSMNNLANNFDHQKKYEEAERLYRQVLELREEVLGGKHPDTLTSINSIATNLGCQKKYEESEKLHRQVLELRKEVLGKMHPGTLNSMHNLAVDLAFQEKYEEAERLFRQVIKLREEVLSREHPDTLNSIDGLVVVLNRQGKCAEAEQILALKPI